MYVKIVKSGNYYESYLYEKEPNPPCFKGTKKRFSDRLLYSYRRSKQSASRARRSFIRLCRANLARKEPPALVTLTTRDSLGIASGYSCLKGFLSNIRRYFGSEVVYIAVPEFQKRGAIHFHILFWGLPSEVVKYERRDRVIQNIWALGYVDCVATDGSSKLAGYLGKYMSKSLSDARLLNKSSYYCSRNVMRPLSFSGNSFSTLPPEFFHTRQLTARTFETQWLGACSYKLLIDDHG